jgi:hypothetical protein
MEALTRLFVNLKNWSWSVDPKFYIDKNEAVEIMEAIKELKKEREDDGK